MVWLVRLWSQGRSSSQQGLLDGGHCLLNDDMKRERSKAGENIIIKINKIIS
jgi:hypothetical protein